MLRQFNKIYFALKKSMVDTIGHDGIEHAGYLSFLCIISAFPSLMFITALTGLIGKMYFSSYSQIKVSSYLTQLMNGSEFTPFINALLPRMIEITSSPPSGIVTIALVSIIWSASSIFEGCRTILNRAYRIDNPPSYFLRRVLSIVEFFLVALAIVLIMLTVSIFSVLINPLISTCKDLSCDFSQPLSYIIAFLNSDLVDLITSFIINLVLVNCFYMFIPSKRQKFIESLPGTMLFLFSLYIFRLSFLFYIKTMPQISLIYGSIAGVVIALIFFYFCAIALIWGAEFNYHFAATTKKLQQYQKNVVD